MYVTCGSSRNSRKVTSHQWDPAWRPTHSKGRPEFCTRFADRCCLILLVHISTISNIAAPYSTFWLRFVGNVSKSSLCIKGTSRALTVICRKRSYCMMQCGSLWQWMAADDTAPFWRQSGHPKQTTSWLHVALCAACQSKVLEEFSILSDSYPRGYSAKFLLSGRVNLLTSVDICWLFNFFILRCPQGVYATNPGIPAGHLWIWNRETHFITAVSSISKRN